MTDENQDIFGKIDALLEKRSGFGAAGHAATEEDFPLLTEVVEGQEVATGERRRGERRLGLDRRQGDRRQAGKESPARPTFTDEQFSRFLGLFEQKLENLFIRQQLRMEECIRRAIREVQDKPQGGQG